jgi:hypothetical protein
VSAWPYTAKRLITDEGVVGGLRVVGAGASLPG